MMCSNCGATFPGGRCPYCGHGGGPQAGAQGPTSRDAEYQAAMGQPTANDPGFRAAMGQPTANDPSWQQAMGQPHGTYGAPPYAPMVGQGGPAPLAKKGCCGCLSVMMLALAAAAGASIVLFFL
jgi:hypothetical protein